jgi:2-keto-4-pentenoate hydratase/2-oxohepta-3-ene-1,7-dioic acid hydratase in catechol pathway
MDRIYRVARGGEVFHAVERDGALRRLTGDLFGAYDAGAPVEGGLAGVRVLAPVLPSKIACIGLNYTDHAAELGKKLPDEPLLFLKPSTAVIGPGDPIRLPPRVGRVHHEAELGVVIGRRAHRVPRARALDVVLGFTCVNDVTARDLQNKDVQYTRSKGFDTFAPIGPCIAVDRHDRPRRVEGRVNGQLRQASDTGHLIFSLAELIAFVTSVMTLEPGDVLSTGTPAGVGELTAGDTVTVTVEDVGELRNPVREEEEQGP